MGNGALATGPKLPRPSSTLPKRNCSGPSLSCLEFGGIAGKDFRRPSWVRRTAFDPIPTPGCAPSLRRNISARRLWRAVKGWVPSTLGMRTGALRPPFIQVGQPFAEHLHTLPGIPVACTGRKFWRLEIRSAGSISSNRAISRFASSSRPASAQLAAPIRSAPWLSGCSRNAIFAHVRASSYRPAKK